MFPKFHQHVTCATRGESILDKVYSNIKQGYRAIPTPHLGQSDHISLFMLPVYIPLRKREPPTSKTVKIWPVDATSQLQDCFDNTDWSIFESQNLEEYTTSVLSYIKHCTDTVTTDKCIRVYANQKPWMTNEV